MFRSDLWSFYIYDDYDACTSLISTIYHDINCLRYEICTPIIAKMIRLTLSHIVGNSRLIELNI